MKEAARLLGKSLRNVAERDIEMNADDGSIPVVIPMEIEGPPTKGTQSKGRTKGKGRTRKGRGKTETKTEAKVS